MFSVRFRLFPFIIPRDKLFDINLLGVVDCGAFEKINYS